MWDNYAMGRGMVTSTYRKTKESDERKRKSQRGRKVD
jgi:hypothetical protein